MACIAYLFVFLHVVLQLLHFLQSFLLVSVLVKEKDVIEEGQPLAVIEAMKMENIIKSEKKAIVKKVNCKEGDSLEVDQVIMEFV